MANHIHVNQGCVAPAASETLPDCARDPQQLPILCSTDLLDNRATDFDSTLPCSLLSDAGVHSFISRTTPKLRRQVPDFMFECADEAAEDAVLAVRKNSQRFDSMAGVCAFACIALKHQALRRRDVFSVEVSLGDAWDNAIDEDPFKEDLDPEAALIEKETRMKWRHEIQWALSQLAEKLRRIVCLRDLSELTYEEISMLDGIATQTAYNIHSKAIQQLRMLLSPDILTC